MMRIPQGPRPKGSQHWLQVTANSRPEVFERELALPVLGQIAWRSPLRSDDFAEYQDAAFLSRLEISLPKRSLSSFWPKRGPVWDGLATTSSGAVLLVEAKANLPELASQSSKASPSSARLIRSSLREAKASFGATPEADWMGNYYQYANRLAHLHLLRTENQVEAYLVFVYYINATEVDGPDDPSDWKEALRSVHDALELGSGPASPYARSVFIDVNELADA